MTDRAFVDFHLHTNCSDGAWSTSRLLDEVQSRGLEYFSISDHDNMDAYPLPADAASGSIAGIEIDTERFGQTVHVLAYWPKPVACNLLDRLTAQRRNRENRAQLIIERLNHFGVALTLEQVRELAQTRNSIGRPHIARALVATKHCETMQQAFDEYLAEGCRAYVALDRLNTVEAIDLVHDGGGLAVLAHPRRLHDQNSLLEVAKLFDGIEAMHPTADATYEQQLFELADELGLVATGGTDFHARATDPQIGVAFPRARLKQLLERLAVFCG